MADKKLTITNTGRVLDETGKLIGYANRPSWKTRFKNELAELGKAAKYAIFR